MIMDIVVDFPEPFGPGSGHLPGRDVKGKVLTATTPPKRSVSPRTSIIGKIKRIR